MVGGRLFPLIYLLFMTKRKMKRSDSSQITFAFPPEPSDDRLLLWRRCKELYKDRIVILIENGYGFTLSTDAQILASITGYDLEWHLENEIICFAYSDLHRVLTAAGEAEVDVVVCDPPEEPACHLFN